MDHRRILLSSGGKEINALVTVVRVVRSILGFVRLVDLEVRNLWVGGR
jgi:hypothetical protein